MFLPCLVHLRLLSSAALTFCLSLWQEELEHLNQASEEINQVDKEISAQLTNQAEFRRLMFPGYHLPKQMETTMESIDFFAHKIL